MTFRAPPQPLPARMALTEGLITEKRTDIARWRDRGSLATQWDGRAEIAGGLIGADAGRVLDIGAGAMALKGFLGTGCEYLPADVVQRSPDCLVVDLNRQEFPLGPADVVTLLGVLEYIHDPVWTLHRAAVVAPRLVVSYCADVSGDTAYRRGLGWVNDFTDLQFEALLREAGWRIERCAPYKRNANNVQNVWACVRNDSSGSTAMRRGE